MTVRYFQGFGRCFSIKAHRGRPRQRIFMLMKIDTWSGVSQPPASEYPDYASGQYGRSPQTPVTQESLSYLETAMAGTEDCQLGDPGSFPPRVNTPLEEFRITVRYIAENTVIELTGELDLATVPVLIARLDGLDSLDEQRPLYLVADVTALTFCDCSGLGALVRAYNRATATGGWLRVCGVAGILKKVIELTRVSSILSCYADVAEALAAPAPDPPTVLPKAM